MTARPGRVEVSTDHRLREPEKEGRDRLLARHRELRKMSVMGGMSRADARELREIGAALDALDREASE